MTRYYALPDKLRQLLLLIWLLVDSVSTHRGLTTPCFTIARHTDSPPSNKQKVQRCYFVTIPLSNALPDLINILFSNTAAIFSFLAIPFLSPLHRAFAHQRAHDGPYSGLRRAIRIPLCLHRRCSRQPVTACDLSTSNCYTTATPHRISRPSLLVWGLYA